MKKFAVGIIKISLYLSIGTIIIVGMIYLVSFYIGSFGAMVVLPAIAFVVIFATLLIYRNVNITMLVILSFLGGSFFYYTYYYEFICGPNPWDVRVMQPMAKAISDYIVKHGIPKSLSEIPGLPYRLEGCEREENNGSIDEDCSFEANGRSIKIKYEYIDDNVDNIRYQKVGLHMKNIRSDTGLHADLESKNNDSFVDGGVRFYSNKTSGICNSMRQ